MSIVKKWASCVVSFVAGVLGLALSACSGMIVTKLLDASALGTLGSAISFNQTETVKAHKVLTDSHLLKQAKELGVESEFLCLKVFAIITLAIAVLLIAYSVVMLLKNLNVIKTSNIVFEIVGVVLAVLFLVAAIGLIVSANNYANAMMPAAESTIKSMITLTLQAQGLSGAALTQTLSAIKFDVVAKIGFYQPAILVTSIVTVIVSGLMFVLNRKKA